MRCAGRSVQFEDQFGSRRQSQLVMLDKNMTGSDDDSAGGANQESFRTGDDRPGDGPYTASEPTSTLSIGLAELPRTLPS